MGAPPGRSLIRLLRAEVNLPAQGVEGRVDAQPAWRKIEWDPKEWLQEIQGLLVVADEEVGSGHLELDVRTDALVLTLPQTRRPPGHAPARPRPLEVEREPR